MQGIGEEGNFSDDRRHVGILTGVKPATAATSSIGAENDSAHFPTVGHSFIEDFGIHDRGHPGGEPLAFLVAVEAAPVPYFPFFRIAVEVEEYNTGGFLIQRGIDAAHADGSALGVVLGAQGLGGVRCVELDDAEARGLLRELGFPGGRSSIGDDTAVTSSLNDVLHVAGIGVPEGTFLDEAVPLVGRTSPAAVAIRTAIVTNIKHDGAGFSYLGSHAVGRAAAQAAECKQGSCQQKDESVKCRYHEYDGVGDGGKREEKG